MIQAIAFSAKTIFFIVLSVSTDALHGVDALEILRILDARLADIVTSMVCLNVVVTGAARSMALILLAKEAETHLC